MVYFSLFPAVSVNCKLLLYIVLLLSVCGVDVILFIKCTWNEKSVAIRDRSCLVAY